MRTGLHQTMSPRLVLAPRMQQSVNLLQMSNMELLFFLRQEMLLNPFLEEKAVEENNENGEIIKENEDKEQDLKIEDWQELFGENSSLEGGNQNDFSEKPIEEKISLTQHLMWQLHMSKLTAVERLVGEVIIGEIDEKGYLRIPIEELAKVSNASVNDVEKVLRVIQTFEPVGVGARNLKECLLLQLVGKSNSEGLAREMLEDCLEEVESKDYNKIASRLDRSLEEVNAAADLISSLNPCPGCALDETNNFYIIPDVIVDKVENEYVVTVNDDRLPRLGLNKYYLRLMKSKENMSSDVSDFLSKKFQSASWILNCIEQRRMTLYQVTGAIVKKQRGFFDNGSEFLCHLSLKQIADIVGLHESTVSRAVSNKYVQTPRGMFELKFFFLRGINTIGKGLVPTMMVKESVRDIIENETVPLSDEEIVVILKQRGIDIARRTVSKYRGELRIPVFGRRKL